METETKGCLKFAAGLYGFGMLGILACAGTCGVIGNWIEKPSAENQKKIDETRVLIGEAYKKASGQDGVLTVGEEQEMITSLGLEGMILREQDKVTIEANYEGIPYVNIKNPADIDRGYNFGKNYPIDFLKLKVYAEGKK